MKTVISEQALAVLAAIANFVESKNTKGSGGRFAMKFKGAIKELAIPNIQYSKCNYQKFAELNYSCSHYNDWVIAFSIENNVLKVHEIIHGSFLA